jgi:ribosome-associated translation inhibitor RaiA
MNIIIKSTNHVLTDDSREFAEKKFKLIERLVGNDQSAQLSADIIRMSDTEKDGARYSVSANLVTRGTLYRANTRAATFETAVETVEHELKKELRTSHGRARSLFKRGATKIKDAIRGWQ